MRRSRAPSIASGTFFVAQSWVDCITNIAGFNLRQAQVPHASTANCSSSGLRSRNRASPPIFPDLIYDRHNRVLSLKPQLRLEWRAQDGQNETEQPDHSASLGDSITVACTFSNRPILGQLPEHATFLSDSNLIISRIVLALVAF